MNGDVELPNYPQKIWSFQTEAVTWSPLENEFFFSVIATILTDSRACFKDLASTKTMKESSCQSILYPYL
ncbi:hypothetical protein AB4K20DRAFT_1884982, partial [Rhizopus microsporus]